MTPSDEETWEAARWDQVRRLFHQALSLPEDRRQKYLQEQCGDDDALLRMVTHMVAADAPSRGFLSSPLPELFPRGLEPGQEVGPFRIVERIGSGNMGEVYRARRHDEFEMEVALKVVDASKVNEERIWRFRHERQILASLGHPNIARIIDGGTLGDGRPWFALEFVEGQRIDRYCDEKKLSVEERILLLRKVCAAVSAAHGLGVVHRDIKPANILVNAEGEPKLLDFGIAKIVEGEILDDDSARHRTGTASGDGDPYDSNPLTPLYASPEQALPLLDPEGDGHPPIGVRSDVFSLGVVLYQLLTGHLPHRGGHVTMVLRAVVEDTPIRPSQVVATTRERKGRKAKPVTPELVAAARRTQPGRLRRRLAGDLDAIVGQALEKRPDDRYGSMAELDSDLCAHLEGYPVMPRQPNRLYRISCFLRRNRILVLAAVFLLVLGGIYSFMDRRAEEQLGETKELLRGLTRIQIDSLSDEEFAERFQQAIEGYEEEGWVRREDRIWLADYLGTLGLDLEKNGHLPAARLLYQESLDLRVEIYGPRHTKVAASYNNLAGAQMQMGFFTEAEKNFLRDIELREELYQDNPKALSRGWHNLATMYQHQGGEHLRKARPWLEKTLALREEQVRRERELGEIDRRMELSLLATKNNLAVQLLFEHQFAEAGILFQDVLAVLTELARAEREEKAEKGEKARESEELVQQRAGVLRNLALVQLGLGRHDEAEASAREAVDIFRKGLLHWRIADAESVLGVCLASQNRLDEARYLLERSIEDLRVRLGPKARHTREAEERLETWLSRRTADGNGPAE